MKPLPIVANACKPKCGHCCGGTTPASRAEIERILTHLRDKVPRRRLSKQLRQWNKDLRICPFLALDKSCFIYEVRPDVCAAFGHIKPALQCPYEHGGEVWFDEWPVEQMRKYELTRAALENGEVMLMSLFGMAVEDAINGRKLQFMSANEYRAMHKIALERAASL